MLKILLLCTLLLYYWYFFASSSKRVKKPITSFPSIAPSYNFKFDSKQPNHFEFIVDGVTVWEHTLPKDTFKFFDGKIVAIDPCHEIQNDQRVPARGKALYEYLKNNPDINKLDFKENSEFTVQMGNVFYFKCQNGVVEKLEMCPSGTIFQNGTCELINVCTNQNDGILLPHPHLPTHYVTCFDEKQSVEKCPDRHIFYQSRCEDVEDHLDYYCKTYPTASILLDKTTRVECKNNKPTYLTCKPGFQFFENNFCESTLCLGKPNGTKLPLPEQTMHPFHFSPGYVTCKNDKIDQTIKCPQKWNEMLSNGDNLSFLPMVFDGDKCSIPSFCDNVFSNDPDVIVPVHEFTKHAKNWASSKLYDDAVGYTCENNVRKRKLLPTDSRISKRFKIENACSKQTHLPIYGNYTSYYDCNSKSEELCLNDTFFNGTLCSKFPKHAFRFNNLPMFSFDSLNEESWIRALDYSKEPAITCSNPESTHVSLYNICSHPDCVNFAFLSTVPELSMFLPHMAKCTFYKNEKVLKKEPVRVKYDFWTQRIAEEEQDENCTPGQKLQTGNFIWDSTVYATCNPKQPFVFCPSTHTTRIVPIDHNYFACEPPDTNNFIFNSTKWNFFETNEIKHIWSLDNNNPSYVRLNRGSKLQIVPPEGLEIPEGTRLNLFVDKPTKLEIRYRVSHPPNMAFDYNDSQVKFHTHPTLNYGFLSKTKGFTDKPLNFPTYNTKRFVFDLETSSFGTVV